MTMEDPLPPGWEKSFSNSYKQHYYYNKVTKESVWEHPSKRKANDGGNPVSRKRMLSAVSYNAESAVPLTSAIQKENTLNGSLETINSSSDKDILVQVKRKNSEIENWATNVNSFLENDSKKDDHNKKRKVDKLLPVIQPILKPNKAVLKTTEPKKVDQNAIKALIAKHKRETKNKAKPKGQEIKTLEKDAVISSNRKGKRGKNKKTSKTESVIVNESVNLKSRIKNTETNKKTETSKKTETTTTMLTEVKQLRSNSTSSSVVSGLSIDSRSTVAREKANALKKTEIKNEKRNLTPQMMDVLMKRHLKNEKSTNPIKSAKAIAKVHSELIKTEKSKAKIKKPEKITTQKTSTAKQSDSKKTKTVPLIKAKLPVIQPLESIKIPRITKKKSEPVKKEETETKNENPFFQTSVDVNLLKSRRVSPSGSFNEVPQSPLVSPPFTSGGFSFKNKVEETSEPMQMEESLGKNLPIIIPQQNLDHNQQFNQTNAHQEQILQQQILQEQQRQQQIQNEQILLQQQEAAIQQQQALIQQYQTSLPLQHVQLQQQHGYVEEPRHEENMDVDDEELFKRSILKEIRDIREENPFKRPEVNNVSEENTILASYNEPLYIVLDTNILLAHLKFISELKDYPLPGVGAPILVIPWMVLQELDSLKDAVNRHHEQTNENGVQDKSIKLNMLARKAIKFISDCLSGEHPRVRGQTVIEANTPIEGFREESNDDSIIHCTLSLKTKANHSHIVMLSNDRNLCNKAIINGVKSFTQQNLMLGLRSLFQDGTVAVKEENYQEYYEEYKMQEVINRRKRQADEISCELQCVLRETFSRVIEVEMKQAYGEALWLNIVKIQPPWTLHDVFTLLERHWIAVFGMIIKRSTKTNISNLKKKIKSLEGKAGNLDSVGELLSEGLVIFEIFSNHSDYDNMLTKAITAAKVLQAKITQYTKPEQPSLPGPQTPSLPAPQSTPTQLENEESSSVDNSSPHMPVMQTFEMLWNTVKRFSSLIFYSLDFPNPLAKELSQGERKPAKSEAKSCLNTITPCLLRLVKTIQSILLEDTNSLPTSPDKVENVLEALKNFNTKVMKKPCMVTTNDLLQFCMDNSTRKVLVQGLTQLDNSYAMLQQCADYTNSS